MASQRDWNLSEIDISICVEQKKKRNSEHQIGEYDMTLLVY